MIKVTKSDKIAIKVTKKGLFCATLLRAKSSDFLANSPILQLIHNIYWLPGTENPADGVTKMKSEMSPMLNLLEFGEFYPGVLRPLKGVCSSEPSREEY